MTDTLCCDWGGMTECTNTLLLPQVLCCTLLGGNANGAAKITDGGGAA